MKYAKGRLTLEYAVRPLNFTFPTARHHTLFIPKKPTRGLGLDTWGPIGDDRCAKLHEYKGAFQPYVENTWKSTFPT